MSRQSDRVVARPAPHTAARVLRTAVPLLLLIMAATAAARAQTGVYTLNGGTATQTNQTYAATLTDQSAVYVLNSGHLTLINCTMTKTGDSSNVNNSSQYGLNAGVLAKLAGTVNITGGSVTTNALGANGLFATGSGSAISMSNGTISASGASAHGVDVTYGGSITLNQVNVTTTGASSSALATDFGGGTVTVTGGTIVAAATSAGSHSAGIYSTGTITVNDANVSSLGDCGGVIDGANSIILTNTALAGALHGIKTWKTMSASGNATVTIDGGSLTAAGGSGFCVTGETGHAASSNLTVRNGATVSASTGKIVDVLSSSTATFTANNVALAGNLVADSTSTLTANLQNGTTLAGMTSHTALTIDTTSTWEVTANSTLTNLTNNGTVVFDAAGLAVCPTGTYTQSTTGTLDILLGSVASFDRLAVTGAANLGGSLVVGLAGDFVPAVGQTFDIITRGSGSGAFAAWTSSTPGLEYTLQYAGTYVRLTITAVGPTVCPGDCDCDGAVGFSDIDYFVAAIPDNEAAWIALYEDRHGGASPTCSFANCDSTGDGHVNFADIDAFVALIPTTCP